MVLLWYYNGNIMVLSTEDYRNYKLRITLLALFANKVINVSSTTSICFRHLKNRIKPIKTDKNNKINRKCFTLFSFVFIGFSKWRKQLIIN